MPARRPLVPILLGPIALAACSGGSSPATPGAGIPFAVVAASPADTIAWLDEPLRITCNRALDLESVSPATVAFRVFDANGTATSETVAGRFTLAGDGEQLLFEPALPTGPDFAGAGLRPGRAYEVTLAGGDAAAGPVLRNRDGLGLATPFVFRFTTRDGTPDQLWRDAVAGGPHRTDLQVATATDLDAVPLGLFGAPPLEVRLSFDQPLDPAADNVPAPAATDPLTRDENQKGAIYLEYQDPEQPAGVFTWLPAEVELARNAIDGATVVLRPVGVLPNHATVRVVVTAALRDLVGEHHLGTPGFDPVFGTFRTADAWGQQWNGIVEQFAAVNTLDPAAPFPEPQAEIGPGFLRAGFAFEGEPTTFDWTAGPGERLLSTHAATLTSTDGQLRTFLDGTFPLRDLTIPADSFVRGVGQNPLVFLCSGAATIAGTLTVRGGNGERGGWSGQYRGPGDAVPGGAGGLGPMAAGGIGHCGGGNGGKGSPSPPPRDLRGGTGKGPGQALGTGGRGGYLACVTGCYTGSGYNGSGGGSGGGGGGMATQGDARYRGTTPTTIQPNTSPTAVTAFQQVRGFGGTGCSGGSGTRATPVGVPGFILAGGEPGDRVFADTRSDNDFWGSGYDARRRLRIAGELTTPIGGGGGGGGGDTSPQSDCSPLGSNPQFDYRGGGGGAGGGVVVIKARGEIRITSTGRIVADGGHGAGGEQVGACGEAGGGGGGAGGMIVLVSATAIRIEAHGNPAQNRFVYGSGSGGPFLGNDYDFALSADGGICTTGGFGAVNVTGKYPAAGQVPMAGTTYDQDPLGGFGGMGIVQLLAPTGTNSDGTNTILDDGIHFYLPGQLTGGTLPTALPAAAKRQLLAWRGMADGSGQAFDDFGNVVELGSNDGDIRPAPVLLPAPFGPRSRARSRWIDTGRSDRRVLSAPDDGARGLVAGPGDVPGPRFEAAGLDAATGWLGWQPLGTSGVTLPPVVVVPATTLQDPATPTTWLGEPSYRLRLADAVLPANGRFAAYDAELLDPASDVLASYRILHHDAQELLLAPGAALPPQATRVRIVARTFVVAHDGVRGLPAHVPAGSSSAAPRANVRVGFAFHTAPDAVDPLAGRYPPTAVDAFVHDLGDPALQAWLATNRPRYVMWDVTFDLAHDAGAGAAPLLLPPRLELRELRLPFRF